MGNAFGSLTVYLLIQLFGDCVSNENGFIVLRGWQTSLDESRELSRLSVTLRSFFSRTLQVCADESREPKVGRGTELPQNLWQHHAHCVAQLSYIT
jgi:hypothetical protein